MTDKPSVRILSLDGCILTSSGKYKKPDITTTDIVVFDNFDEIAEMFTILLSLCRDTKLREKYTHKTIERYKEAGALAFVDNKEKTYIWFDRNKITKERLIAILGHELGHLQRPYRKEREKEEAKAEVHSQVAVVAFTIAEQLLKGE